MPTSEDFIVKDYTIQTSFSNRTIYMKLTNTSRFITYETYLDNNDFHLSLPLESVYYLITNCFAEDAGYNVDITILDKIMTLQFHAQINSFIV